MTIYLTLDQIVAVNASLEGGVGIRDQEALEHLAFRPQTELYGQQMFGNVWLKAAAYIEGFSSQQPFFDGNKRTAWLVSQIFLEVNGYEMPRVADIEAETFAQAVAQQVFNTDENGSLTLEKAAEWFRVKWDTAPVGASVNHRVGDLALVQQVHFDEASQMPIYVGPGLHGAAAPSLPHQFEFWVVGTVYRDPALSEVAEVTAMVYPTDGPLDVENPGSGVRLPPPVASPNPIHAVRGLTPTVFRIPLSPTIQRSGSYVVLLQLDGEIAGALHLRIEDVDSTVDDDKLLWLGE